MQVFKPYSLVHFTDKQHYYYMGCSKFVINDASVSPVAQGSRTSSACNQQGSTGNAGTSK